MLTFLDLQDRVLRWMDEVLDVDQTRVLVKDALNAVHRRLMSSRSWPSLRWHREESFTTTSGVKLYALNPAMGKILNIWSEEGGQFLPVIPRRAWEGLGVNRSATDVIPYGVSFGPVWPVKQQPVEGILTVVGSGGETSNLVIEGVGTDGELITETIALTGTTPHDGSQIFTYITRVSCTGAIVGTRTLKDAGANTLLSLTSTQLGKAYPTLEFLESPLGSRTFKYDFQRQPDALVNDNDIPNVWPNACAELLVYDALYDLVTYNTELGLKEQRIWKERRDEFYKQLLDASDEEIVGAYPRFVRDLEGGVEQSRRVMS